VLREWMEKGIAAFLMRQCIEYAKTSGMRQIGLEVAEGNTPAIALYEKSGFLASKTNAPFVSMILNI